MLAAMAALSDMGGRREYFAPIVREPDEPVFHEPWERRVFGMTLFVQTLIGPNVDAFRYAMEQLPPEIYMASYYRRWLGGFERRLVDTGYLGAGELDARVRGTTAEPGEHRMSRVRSAVIARVMPLSLRPRLPRLFVARVLPLLTGSSRPALTRRRFSLGDRVRVRGVQASGHTRQPGYVTGKLGEVVAHHGATLFPDARAVGRRTLPQHLYTVAFQGGDLWGDAAEPGTEVCVDLYEPYLEQA
jgi:nitrile hydratase